ncbi:UDP-N-acetylmuramoylalanine--D-glutamate ligase [Arcanobacterium wilhelmae]|uniref:UDP-N-acetylmuramoylalanine--D-glutamate ligase n=1 Tax=Arcanobacterium wilhelmae TaxID=1803177 RepID=A0ABT9NA08_9ACTO|nr:UDP-N-acetylmuramoyl-L-alanine--D-glutamate ligase [Arcanobacterium wilhelmae]MDP9800251.1 UDP-N-acetylmuramoylalanine--D-glutamate ligase [Arcanobacterium wilhelmae]WFN89690.1 UDP-N-acetylmuramoyl-L-alanine--D-glutamate ligase [Arcanobacterium wilhelmae]
MVGKAVIPGAHDFEGKRVAILGMGKSGRAAFEVLSSKTGAVLSVWDSRPEAVEEFAADGGAHHDGEVLVAQLLRWRPDVVVIAPAFRQSGPEWAALRAAGMSVWSEIELAWHLRAQRADGSFAPWLAITGTNGKTTTTTMLESILQAAGLRGVAVGNVGNPAVTAVSDESASAPGAFAFELSSFQLAATASMSPAAAVCLNIDDDHLEWHNSRREYHEAKANVYNRAQVACLYPVGDTEVQEMVDDADVVEGARAIGLTLGVPSVGQIGLVDDVVVDRAFTPKRYTHAAELFSVADIEHLAPAGLDLPLHIMKDAMVAASLALSIGVEPVAIRDGIRAYHPGRHRIELVATLDGVRYVDDSKATNAHAARASVLAQGEKSVVWIVGGQAKGAHFGQLVGDVASRLAAVVVIGTDQQPWLEALAGLDVPVHYVAPDSAQPMAAAVAWARANATEGNTVLLAPASASMDQFASYADRGEKFAQAVREQA